MNELSERIKAWGQAPTPVVPKEFVRKIGNVELPVLSKRLGFRVLLASLNGEIWNSLDRLNSIHLHHVVNFVRKHRELVKSALVPSNPTLVSWLVDVPLTQHIIKILKNHQSVLETEALRFSSILEISECSFRDALEIACLIETASEIQLEMLFASDLMGLDIPLKTPNYETAYTEIESVFQSLAAWTAGSQRHRSLSKALPMARTSWPSPIRQRWQRLKNLDAELVAGQELKKYEATGLIEKFFYDLSPRSRHILEVRSFRIENRMILNEVGKSFQISRERVRQLEKKALEPVNEFKTDLNSPVMILANRLKNRLGKALPATDSSLTNTVNQTVQNVFDFEHEKQSFAHQLLLWIAGPFTRVNDWYVSDKKIFIKLERDLAAVAGREGSISDRAFENTLVRNHIRLEYKSKVIASIKQLTFTEGKMIYLSGSNLDKAVSILQFKKQPLTAVEIVNVIGAGSSVRLQKGMRRDSRFWRINKQNQFVLAKTKGYEDYTTIVDKIDSMLVANQGCADLYTIVNEITQKFGVKENTVLAYLHSPRYAIDADGKVRFENSTEIYMSKLSLENEKNCFCTESGFWVWRVQIDKNILRGSGRTFPNSLAYHLGCPIGNSTYVQSEFGLTYLSWASHSLSGATIGSLREAAKNLNAEIDDYLFLVAKDSKLEFELLSRNSLKEADSDLIRAALMLKCGSPKDDVDALKKVAVRFDLPYTSFEKTLYDLRQELHYRGEKAILDVTPFLAIKYNQPEFSFLFEKNEKVSQSSPKSQNLH